MIRRVLLLGLLGLALGVPAVAWAPIAVDGTSSGHTTGQQTSVTSAHTVTSNTNGLR